MTHEKFIKFKRILQIINIASQVLYDNSTDLESDYRFLYEGVCPIFPKEQSIISFSKDYNNTIYPLVIQVGLTSPKNTHTILIDESSIIWKGLHKIIDYNRYMESNPIPDSFIFLLDKLIDDTIDNFNISRLQSNINNLLLQRGY